MTESILSRLAGYMRAHRRASLADLAIGLDAAPAALQGMLGAFERKGQVRRVAASAACGKTCCKCEPSTVTVFEWTGDDHGSPAVIWAGPPVEIAGVYRCDTVAEASLD